MWSSQIINYLILAFFGAIGVMLRFVLTMLIPKIAQINIPILLVNILGSFLIGILYKKLFLENQHMFYLWAAVGFCGGLTTFSTFTLDFMLLLQQHKIYQALTYGFLSILLCMGAVWAGLSLK